MTDIATTTTQTLIDVFSFDPERAAEAVRSVADPGDVAACVNWLLDAGEPDRGGPVVPTQLCPHIHDCSSAALRFVTDELFAPPRCSVCGEDGTGEWLCLTSGQCFCGRYSRGHGLAHWQENSAHCVALGLGDLSVWCHECGAYVKHSRLEPLLRRAARAKFGADAHPAPSAEQQPDPEPQPLARCTALFHDPQTARHAPPAGAGRAISLECPARTRAVVEALEARGLASRCVAVAPPAATRAELERGHDAAYVDAVEATATGAPMPRHMLSSSADADDASEATGAASADADAAAAAAAAAPGACAAQDTYWVAGTAEAAARSAGCAIGLARALASERVANGFALCRPPGHHARRAGAAGGCVYSNAALAALAVLAEAAEARVLVLDWDVHHGDGTQELLWGEERALVCSVHCIEPVEGGRFPDAGEPHHIGGGGGGSDGGAGGGGGGGGGCGGRNVNIALPYRADGHGDASFEHALDALLLPMAREFAPTLVLVAAGFDAAKGDPCGVRFGATPAGYARLTRRLLDPTQLPSAQGRVGLVLEGGYGLQSLGDCVAACVGALLGDDPPPTGSSETAPQAAPPEAIAAVAAAAAAHGFDAACGSGER